MSHNLFAGLVYNAALLLSLSLIYDVFYRRKRAPRNYTNQIIFGLVIGLVAVLLMTIPARWDSGIIFDTRTVLLGLTGLFFGTIPTLTAMAIALIYRFFLGGVGTLPGFATILSSGLIGLAWRYYRFRESKELSFFELYLFGVIVHVFLILSMFLLPQEVMQRTISALLLPALLVYPACTALLGILLSREQKRHRLKEELEVSEELHRSILRTSKDGIWRISMQGRFLEVNEAYCRMSGYSRKELQSMSISDVEVKETPEDIAAQILKTRQRETYRFESQHRRKDGTVFDVEVSIQYLAIDGGQCVAFLRDITERKLAESELKKTQTLYAESEKIAKIGGWELDVSSGELKWTDEVYRIFEVDSTFKPTLEKTFSFFPPSSQTIIEHAVHNAVEFGESYNVELDILTAKGNIKSIQTEGNVGANNHKIVGFIQDITERKRTEEELLQIQELFTLFMKYSPIYTFIKKIENNQSRIIQISDNYIDMLGRPAEELLGQSVEDLFPAEFARKMTDDDLAVVNIGKVVEVDEDFNGRNYTTIKFPIFREGKDSLIAGFTIDITERKQAELERRNLADQLHQSQKIESVGRLAGGVAHDYNNMLSVIIGYAELGRMKVDQSNPLRDNFDQILAAAMRSRDITRQLLAFARRQTIAPKVLDLNATVEAMLKMLRKLLGENINLVWIPRPGLWPVEIDPSQLDQILANLCVNARDAIADVGKMTIETSMVSLDQAFCYDHPGFIPGDFVMLTVSDDGCGMDKGTLDKIFEPFFTTKQVGKGTGLGLAMVYGVVKQSNGFINVYSEPGKGAIFKIYLPRHMGQVVDEHAVAGGEPLKGHGEMVLVVEDEKSILTLIEAILSDFDYKVLAASSPSEALALAKAHPGQIRLLITDVVMPEMNGRELADQLQCMSPDLKCLYMSGYTADVIAHHGVLDKGLHFIQKPFTRTDFSLQIRKALDSKR
ncbi:MAG: PAS domain S-box protein [Desulfuromonadales bacterium]